jgi:hypothetical protein
MSKFNLYLEAVRKQKIEKPEKVAKPVKKKIAAAVEPAQSTGGKFVLPPKADPSNYQITNSVRDFHRNETGKWKAKTLVANNGGDKGKFETVGYIAINLKNNQIIPISRNDEHQAGYEILRDYYRNKGIIESVNDWMTVSTSNYLYHKEDVKRWLIAAKKWIEYGGDSGTPLVSSGYDGQKKFTTTFEDYIAHEGDPPTSHAKTGILKPKGKEFVSIIERLARSIAAYHKGRPDIKAFDYALDLVDWDKRLGLGSPMFELIHPLKSDNWDAFKKYEEGFKTKVMAAMAKEDYATLEKLAFGFDGWKNLAHTGLKHWQKIQAKGKIGWQDEDSIQKVESVFGDLETAIKELDRVGGI